MKLKILFFMFFLLLGAKAIQAINLNVGETTTLSITAPSHLDGCQWTISRPNDVVFTTTPSFYSTSVEIKAVHGFASYSPCVVQCTYYYLELDPIKGQYTYRRQGKQKWNIYVGETGETESSTGNGSSRITLNVHFMTEEQNKWAGSLYPVAYNGPEIKWECNRDIAALYRSYAAPNTVDVEGLAIGRTYIKCKNDYGGSDICELNVLPKSIYSVGSDIKLYHNDEVLTFEVLSNSPKTCKLYSTYNTVTQSYNSTQKDYLSLPDYPGDYKLTTIGSFTFYKNNCMKRIVLPETVETIDDKAFWMCSALEEIILPETLKTIGNLSFDSNTKLKKIILPQNLQSIGYCAFSDCPALEEIILPESLKTIAYQAFANDSKLKQVIFPKSLQSIDNDAFRGCQMEKIEFEEGLKEIGNYAFWNVPCKHLILPSTITSIGSCAFSNTEIMTTYESITCRMGNPTPIDENVFRESTYNQTILYVPSKSKLRYMMTAGWNKFKNIREYEDSSQILVSDITISPQSKTLNVGDTFTFTALISPENASNKSVTWKSLNNSVATVSDNGTVTAKSVGSASIICTANDVSGKSAYSVVQVLPQEVLVSRIELNKAYDELEIGQASQLTATVYPSNATNKTVNWKSSNNSVAIVSSSGLVTAKGIGTATITCSANDSGNAKSTCTVKVKAPELEYLHSLGEALERAAILANLEYSKEYVIDFEPVVTFVDGASYHITQDSKYSIIYKGDLGLQPGQTVNRGWKAKLLNYNGILELVPLEGTKIIGGNIGTVPDPVTIKSADEINSSVLSAVVFIDNVVFTSDTPSSRTTFTGKIGNQDVVFYNKYAVSSQSAGNYSVRATIGSYNGLQVYPIVFYSKPTLQSLNEAFEKAANLAYGEYSEPYIIDFESVVTFVGGASYHITQNGKYSIIYKAGIELQPGQTVNRGWKAKLHNYHGAIELVPVDEEVVTGGNIGDIPEPVVIQSADDITNSLISAVVIVNDVVFTSDTPESRTTFNGMIGHRDVVFYNNYAVPSQPSGTYNIRATINYYNGLQVQPIEYFSVNSVEAILIDNEPPVYFDLQGLRVDTPLKGRLYIRLQNGKAEKILMK